MKFMFPAISQHSSLDPTHRPQVGYVCPVNLVLLTVPSAFSPKIRQIHIAGEDRERILTVPPLEMEIHHSAYDFQHSGPRIAPGVLGFPR